jgi:Phospholipase B.
MYAAGYYEGFQTYQLIWDAWNNFVELLLNNKSVLPGDAQQFVTNQTNWILKTAQDNIKDNFWQLINATMSQLFGMYDGYLAAIQKNGLSKEYHLTFDEFYFLTNMGDLEDIIPAYSSDFPYRYFG